MRRCFNVHSCSGKATDVSLNNFQAKMKMARTISSTVNLHVRSHSPGAHGRAHTALELTKWCLPELEAKQAKGSQPLVAPRATRHKCEVRSSTGARYLTGGYRMLAAISVFSVRLQATFSGAKGGTSSVPVLPKICSELYETGFGCSRERFLLSPAFARPSHGANVPALNW